MRLKVFIKNNILTIILAVIGMVGGFLYWKFVGCESGTCAIKSNMWLMTAYGGVIGGLIGNMVQGFNRKKGSSEN
jgi:predicted MFS family arabinose efflux permease